MIATVATLLALAAPGCHAPECLVEVGADPAVMPGPLRLDVQRVHSRLTIELSSPALLTLRAGPHGIDVWLAPAGTSVHPLRAARPGVLELRAVDGAGSTVTRVLPAP